MMKLIFSNMNQTWFLCWYDQIVSMYETKNEAITDLRYMGLVVSRAGVVSVAESTNQPTN